MANRPRRIVWHEPSSENPPELPLPQAEQAAGRVIRSHPPTPVLDSVGRDLTLLAQERRLKSLFGREKELLRLQRILLRKVKNSPLLVGAPGVGKTSLVEGFACRAALGQLSPEFQDVRVVEISAAALTAGTGVRGTFESRLQSLLEEALSDPQLIIFIDEIHTLVRAGAVEGGALDAANILKPALARGEMRLIGAATLDEYERFLRSDLAFERRFEALTVEEPAETETVEILAAAKGEYERHHRLKILDEAVLAAVRLSSQHILERRLPDKAFDLLDSACTYVRLPEGGRGQAGQEPLIVDEEAVRRSLAEKLGIPVQKLSRDMQEHLVGLQEFLEGRIVGQPWALERTVSAVQGAFADLNKPGQPRGVLAFFGSSGVGKTETAKVLAEFLFGSPDALLRLDMSEFKEAHSMARLFGSPPGYMGYGDEGNFASRLRRQPYCVVLLDEIEKAHPDVHDAFLQIFDDGRFTDGRGRLIEARHAFFVLTSNLFSLPEINSTDEYDQHSRSIRQSLQVMLRTEFVNRLSELVLFRDLNLADLMEIARKEIRALQERLQRYSIELSAGEEALEWLARQGNEPGSGARGVIRSISRYVVEGISRALIEGEITEGGRANLGIEGDRLVVQRHRD